MVVTRNFCWWICCIAFLMVSNGSANLVSETEWLAYKAKFQKDYRDAAIPEAYSRYYYNYNWALKNAYNATLTSYQLSMNQFSDLLLAQANLLFPEVTHVLSQKPDTSTPVLQPATATMDYRSVYNLQFKVENQGTLCNSGWAYAVAKAVEIFSALNTGIVTRLSAQNLIDCAGGVRACTKQIPERAFEFLTIAGQPLRDEASYQNTNTSSESGMCVYNSSVVPKLVTLSKFGIVADSDDALLQQLVSNGYPVVVEFNPTSFQFMYYANGIFDPPATLTKGSHFMVVVGYGTENSVDYWLLQNSFGEYWGENGYIRIKRDRTKPITKNAFYPME